MPDTQNIPGLEYTNYAAGERPPLHETGVLPVVRPLEPLIRDPTPLHVAKEVSPQFQDTSLTFEQRMARNQLPTASPSSTPFLDRAKALQERANTGIHNLIGGQSAPTSAPIAPKNILADRTGALVAAQAPVAPTTIPAPSPLAPIKPGAQPNSFIGPKLNTTPSVIPTADKLPSLIDARYANKIGTEYPQ